MVDDHKTDDKPIKVQLDKPVQLEVTYGSATNTFWSTIQATTIQIAMYGALIGMLFMPSCMREMGVQTGSKGRVAKMHINGAIGAKGYGNTDATKMLDYIDAAQNTNAAAYWFVINSPGGYVYPSKEIADKITEVRAGKDGMLGTTDDIPVVMQIKDMGASGAYWIAVTGERIFADEASLVGSIGVKMGYLEYSDLLKKIGVEPVEIGKGKYKNMGSPFRKITPEEKKLLEDHLDTAYKMFIDHVAKNRNMKYDDVEQLATGWVFYGKEAKEKKLVDEIGGTKSVEAYLKQKLGKSTLDILEYKDQPGLFDSLAAEMGESMGRGMAESLQRDLSRE